MWESVEQRRFESCCLRGGDEGEKEGTAAAVGVMQGTPAFAPAAAAPASGLAQALAACAPGSAEPLAAGVPAPGAAARVRVSEEMKTRERFNSCVCQ